MSSLRSSQCHTPTSRISRPIRRAFTLLEIIVVVTIIALLATLVAPKLLSNIWKTKQRVAKNEVAQIANQLKIYLVDNGQSSPPADLELTVLVPDYLKQSDLKDPWEHDYLLVMPGDSGEEWDIVSLGGDGEKGGDGENKDVNSNIEH